MKVELISYTQNPIQQMYLAATRCVTAGEVKPSDPETMERVVEKCLNAGHLTVAEFVDFTFSIEGITRSCSHQLVRHRHASFCQMSERRVVLGTDDDVYYLDEEYLGYGGGCCSVEVEAEEAFSRIFGKVPKTAKMNVAISFLEYRDLIKNGVPVEQARAVLPECTLTNLYMHVNFRALIEMAKLRLCGKAELEIRTLFDYIVGTVEDIPDGMFLAKWLKPKCHFQGRCNEEKPCGYFQRFEEKEKNQ